MEAAIADQIFLIRKSSTFLPLFIAASIHLGFSPRPAHVSLLFSGLRYFGFSFLPASWVALFFGKPLRAILQSARSRRYFVSSFRSCSIPSFSRFFSVFAFCWSSRILASRVFKDVWRGMAVSSKGKPLIAVLNRKPNGSVKCRSAVAMPKLRSDASAVFFEATSSSRQRHSPAQNAVSRADTNIQSSRDLTNRLSLLA